jgi:hypothetical protein
MKKPARKINATTQRFTEIEDIVDDVVVLSGGYACMVLEVTATNFTLQSKEEQESKIFSYASLLNSLSFPIQILVISRKLDVTSYLKQLDAEAKKTTNNMLASHIEQYKQFVSELVKVNTVLDKKFYIVVSYSYLEKGGGAVLPSKDKNAFALDAKNLLRSKSSSLIPELLRIGLKSKVLGKEELLNLFYELYNHEAGEAILSEAVSVPVVKATP